MQPQYISKRTLILLSTWKKQRKKRYQKKWHITEYRRRVSKIAYSRRGVDTPSSFSGIIIITIIIIIIIIIIIGIIFNN